MSKGGPPSTQKTIQTVQLPQWLDTAAQQTVATAQQLAQRPYQASPYQDVASLTPDQQQAYGQIRSLQGTTAPAYAASEGQLTGLLGEAQPLTTGGLAADTSALMNPYNQNVVDTAATELRRQGDITNQQIRDQAGNVGAFGGTRQAVLEGTQDAETERQIANLSATLQQQGYGQALGAAQNLEQTNLGLGMTAATELPQLATAGANETAELTGLLGTAGQQQQKQAQAELDALQGRFYQQQDWPVQNLALEEGAIAGVPYGTTTTGTAQTQQSRNVAAGILGGAASGASIGSMFGPVGTGIGAGVGGLLGLF